MTDPVTTVRPEPGRHWPSSPLSQEQEIRARALELAITAVLKMNMPWERNFIRSLADNYADYIASGSKPGEK